jgi:hypothetical protein
MTPTLSINDWVIEDCFRLVQEAEIRSIAVLLAPFHTSSCPCRICETDRWIKSEDAAEFARRKR